MVKDHSDSERGNLLPPHGATLSSQQQGFFYMHHPTDRITHTTAFVTPVWELNESVMVPSCPRQRNRRRCVLQQLALNVHIKHSDLTWPDLTWPNGTYRHTFPCWAVWIRCNSCTCNSPRCYYRRGHTGWRQNTLTWPDLTWPNGTYRHTFLCWAVWIRCNSCTCNSPRCCYRRGYTGWRQNTLTWPDLTWPDLVTYRHTFPCWAVWIRCNSCTCNSPRCCYRRGHTGWRH